MILVLSPRTGSLHGQLMGGGSCAARRHLAAAFAGQGLAGAAVQGPHLQQGQVWCLSSQPARHSPQKVWPQGAKEWEQTMKSRHTTHSSSFSSLSTKPLGPAGVLGFALPLLPGAVAGLLSTSSTVLASTWERAPAWSVPAALPGCELAGA